MKPVSFLMISLLLLMGGCSFAPDYQRPETPVPQTWPEGKAYPPEKGGETVSTVPDLKWETFFTDPRLRQIIRIALDQNRDLRLSMLNVKNAQALYGIQKAQLYPSVNATGSMSSMGVPGDISRTGDHTSPTEYDVNVGISAWEIDFFGRLRNLKDSALETYLSTDEARRSAQILLIASTASAYLNLAADRDYLNLAQTTFKIQQDSYNIINRRFQVGLATEPDVKRAQTQVDTARGDIARYTQQVALDINALNLLLGSRAPDNVLQVNLSDISKPEGISSGISSEILLNRPDILAAEHQLKGAYANIGAARAALFPRITLTSTVGTASTELSGLFGSGSDAWNFFPQITIPIFDARLWSAYDAANVQREIALTQYEKTIQTAFREVADALAVNGTVGEQLAAQDSLVKALEIIFLRSEARYQKGIDSYLSVLDAQRTLYAARQGLVALQLAKIANEVKLYAVLGGGSE